MPQFLWGRKKRMWTYDLYRTHPRRKSEYALLVKIDSPRSCCGVLGECVSLEQNGARMRRGRSGGWRRQNDFWDPFLAFDICVASDPLRTLVRSRRHGRQWPKKKKRQVSKGRGICLMQNLNVRLFGVWKRLYMNRDFSVPSIFTFLLFLFFTLLLFYIYLIVFTIDMHLFGFSKKAKNRLSRSGLRKCKSTGNLSVDKDDDDSSFDSDSDNEEHHARYKSLDAGMDQKRQELESKPQIGVTEAAPPLVKVNDETPTTNPPPTQSGVDPNDLNALLSMETQQRVDAQTERNKTAGPPLRPTRLKFELPVTPSRSRSPNNQSIAYPRARPYRSLSEEGSISVHRNQQADAAGKSGRRRKRRHHRWSRLIGSDTDEDSSSEQAEKARAKRHLEIGTFVSLIKRPLPTMGYVRYIGPVGDEPGEWIGVELEHRGKINGMRTMEPFC